MLELGAKLSCASTHTDKQETFLQYKKLMRLNLLDLVPWHLKMTHLTKGSNNFLVEHLPPNKQAYIYNAR